VTHEESKAKLDTYLDGELDSAEAAEVDRHLRECAACSAEALRRVQWKRALKQAGERYMSEGRASKPRQSARPFFGIPLGLAARQWLPATALALAAILVLAGITIDQGRMRRARQN